MGPLSVRQAVLADLEPMAELFDRYREFQGQARDLPAARRFLRARIDHGESVIFLAHRGGEAVGFAQLYPSYSSTALARVFILNDLYVDTSARRQGVARALLDAVEHHTRSLGAVRVTLNVTRDNVAAQALYHAQGWTRDEQFFMYHRFAGDR